MHKVFYVRVSLACMKFPTVRKPLGNILFLVYKIHEESIRVQSKLAKVNAPIKV
jgi:hypothetical protein